MGGTCIIFLPPHFFFATSYVGCMIGLCFRHLGGFVFSFGLGPLWSTDLSAHIQPEAKEASRHIEMHCIRTFP